MNKEKLTDGMKLGIREEGRKLWVAPVRESDGVVMAYPRICEFKEGRSGAKRGESVRWHGFDKRDREFAEQVVLRWNAHAALIEACEKAKTALLTGQPQIVGDDTVYPLDGAICGNALNALRQAITKATR